MDAYILQGCALVRTLRRTEALVAERKAAPGAIDMCPAEALEQIGSQQTDLRAKATTTATICRRVPMPRVAVKPTLRSTVTDAGSSLEIR